MAQSAITWDELQSPTQLSDPYEHLTDEQATGLSSLYQLQEWAKDNNPAPDSIEAREIKRLEQLFRDEGLDTDTLLLRVDDAIAYWQSRRQNTNPNLEAHSVQLSGYVLPLKQSPQDLKASRVSEFLLVPFVGACIHVPPPPPNQIIYISPTEPIEDPGLFSSVRVTGTLHANSSSHEVFQVDGSRIVEVSYAMDMDAIALAPDTTTPKIAGPWWRTLSARISNVLTVSLGNLARKTSPQTFGLAILLSFSYGVLHTLGPGHGKAVIVSYFVGHNGSLKRGIAMGSRIAIFHVFSAVLIAVLTDTVLQQFGGTSAGSFRYIRLLSYGAIAFIGIRMLQQALKKQRRTSKNNIDSSLTDSNANVLDKSVGENLLYPRLCEQIAVSKPDSTLAECSCLTCDERRGFGGLLALAVGAVPCSGAMLVLLYGLANNLLWPSIAMVISISLGMAFTLGWIGVFAILGNRYGHEFSLRRQRKLPLAKIRQGSWFSLFLSGQIIGACCVSLLGIGLFFLTLLTPS